jgi:tau tubulin kinase
MPAAQANVAGTSAEPAVASEPEQQEEGRFTVAALTFTQVAFLGRQMIRAMQCLHEHGYLHRDVKPSNFALGLQPGTISTCYTIDFGLARRYVDANGAHLEPRLNPGFRGTARYASLNAHRNLELSRRDDLWSVFFIVFEFLVGVLPWAGLSARDEIGAAKEQWLVDSAAEGPSPICTLPHPLPAIFQVLQKLEYGDKPDYDAIVSLFDHAGPPEPMSDPSCDPPSDPITPASPPRKELAGLMPPAVVAVAAAAASTAQVAEASLPAEASLAAEVKTLCPRPPTHARPPSGRRGGRPPLLMSRRNRFTAPQGEHGLNKHGE